MPKSHCEWTRYNTFNHPSNLYRITSKTLRTIIIYFIHYSASYQIIVSFIYYIVHMGDDSTKAEKTEWKILGFCETFSFLSENFLAKFMEIPLDLRKVIQTNSYHTWEKETQPNYIFILSWQFRVEKGSEKIWKPLKSSNITGLLHRMNPLSFQMYTSNPF